jgi:hypothetical protein
MTGRVHPGRAKIGEEGRRGAKRQQTKPPPSHSASALTVWREHGMTRPSPLGELQPPNNIQRVNSRAPDHPDPIATEIHSVDLSVLRLEHLVEVRRFLALRVGSVFLVREGELEVG